MSGSLLLVGGLPGRGGGGGGWCWGRLIVEGWLRPDHRADSSGLAHDHRGRSPWGGARRPLGRRPRALLAPVAPDQLGANSVDPADDSLASAPRTASASVEHQLLLHSHLAPSFLSLPATLREGRVRRRRSATQYTNSN